jgi:pilus assembly protein CpaF
MSEKPDELADLMADPSVLEIMVDGFNRVYVEQKGNLTDVASPFRDDDHLQLYITKLTHRCGVKIDASMVDMILPEGARATAVFPPVSTIGCLLVIRKTNPINMTFERLIELKSLSLEMVEFLKTIVRQNKNIIVAGGTGSGKTTILNVLANFAPEDERVIVLQEGEEIKMAGRRVIPLYPRAATGSDEEVTMRQLVRQAMKMRPDRIILSELRGDEAVELISAMGTGHDGSMTSMHANSVRDCLSRVETLYSLGMPSIPLLTIREQIAGAVHYIIQQMRLSDGVRRIMAITEVTGMEGGNIQTQDIFVFRQAEPDENSKIKGEFVATGNQPVRK